METVTEIPSKTKVPIYLLSGWYDHHHGSSMKTWERLNEETKQHSWLEIGAWNHFFQICLEDKEVLHPQNEEIPKMLEWFELTLKQKKSRHSGSVPMRSAQTGGLTSCPTDWEKRNCRKHDAVSG